MGLVSLYILIITQNVNELNCPIKIHRVAGWNKIQDPITCYLQETHFSLKNIHKLKVKRQKIIPWKIFHKPEISVSSYAYIRQIGFKLKKKVTSGKKIII